MLRSSHPGVCLQPLVSAALLAQLTTIGSGTYATRADRWVGMRVRLEAWPPIHCQASRRMLLTQGQVPATKESSK